MSKNTKVQQFLDVRKLLLYKSDFCLKLKLSKHYTRLRPTKLPPLKSTCPLQYRMIQFRKRRPREWKLWEKIQEEWGLTKLITIFVFQVSNCMPFAMQYGGHHQCNIEDRGWLTRCGGHDDPLTPSFHSLLNHSWVPCHPSHDKYHWEHHGGLRKCILAYFLCFSPFLFDFFLYRLLPAKHLKQGQSTSITL